MRHRKVQRCIQLYNALATVFVHYEKIYHLAWFEYCAQVQSCLATPLLTKDPKTKRFVVNFNPYITEVIREAEYMYKLDLEVPAVGQILVFCKDKLLNAYETVKHLVNRNNTIRKNIPSLFIPLMRVQLLKMENVFMPGLSTITWTSMKIPEFCEDVENVLNYIEVFVKEVKDMKEARIDEIIDSISTEILVYLPESPLPPSKLFEANVEHRKTKGMQPINSAHRAPTLCFTCRTRN